MRESYMYETSRDMNDKICPIAGMMICAEEKCAWWVQGECAVVRIVRELETINGKDVTNSWR
jgi:hypothetical protein